MLGLTGIFCYGKGGDKSKIREEFKRINYSVVEFHSSTATVEVTTHVYIAKPRMVTGLSSSIHL